MNVCCRFRRSKEHEYIMKRRLEDQDTVIGSQRQLPGGVDSFQHRVLNSASSLYETAPDNMQPSSSMQYAVSQTYQVQNHQQFCIILVNMSLFLCIINILN